MFMNTQYLTPILIMYNDVSRTNIFRCQNLKLERKQKDFKVGVT